MGLGRGQAFVFLVESPGDMILLVQAPHLKSHCSKSPVLVDAARYFNFITLLSFSMAFQLNTTGVYNTDISLLLSGLVASITIN